MSMEKGRPLAIRWPRKGLTPAPEEERCLKQERIAWARDSLGLKWGVGVRAGVNQYPGQLTTLEGWKRWPSSSIAAVLRVVFWLGVRQWISSILGTEKDTPMPRPFAAMVEKSLCRQRMFPL